MERQALVLAAFLLTSPAAAAGPPADLLDAARRLEQFPATSAPASESERLARYFDLYWETRMLAAPELATYLGHPGLDDRLSDQSPETIALLERIARLELAALQSIDRGRLTVAERGHYHLARRRLERGIEGQRFAEIFGALQLDQMNGIGIADLLGAMPARTVDDYENRLARMRRFPVQVDQAMAWLAKGLAAGITPPRVTLRDVPENLARALTEDPAESPYLASFEELPPAIPAVEAERLRREALRIYTAEVAPALRRLHAFLVETYVPGARESIAASDLPGGAEWYAFLLRRSTTTDLTPRQVHDLGLSEVARIRKEMDALIAKIGFAGGYEAFSRDLRTDPRFFHRTPEELIAGYREIAKRIDPKLVELFGRLPRLPYGVKTLREGGDKSAPVAYYMNGTLAGGAPGWFLINTYDLAAHPKWAMAALALHESVPGHHLQYALVEEIGDIPQWRRWDVYPAFSEGWGLYAESLGEEIGLYDDPYAKFGQLTFEIWRACRMVVDPGLHLFGWTRQQAIDYYRANSARSDQVIEAEVDRIIVQPGSVPAYKVGELKIKQLRRHAERALGDRFDLRAFHDHLLGRGQLPLDLLEESVREWVGERQQGVGR